jgi:serine/threonine protein phosphatase PrpC
MATTVTGVCKCERDKRVSLIEGWFNFECDRGSRMKKGGGFVKGLLGMLVFGSTAGVLERFAAAARDESERVVDERQSLHFVRREAVGVASAQGGRDHQEDRVSVTRNAAPGVDLYAVYDGHGGARCSHLAAQVFPKAFGNHFAPLHVRASVGAIRDAAKSAVRDTEAEYVAATRHKKNVYEGSTLVFAAVRHFDVRGGAGSAAVDGEPEKHKPTFDTDTGGWYGRRVDAKAPMDRRSLDVVVGNVGDSRCVLCGTTRATDQALTRDHKPELRSEAARIQLLGGHVARRVNGDTWRVYDGQGRGGLAMSRALGDTFYAEAVPATPEVVVQTIDLRSDVALVLASDGVWDVADKTAVCDLVREAQFVGRAERDKDAVAGRAARAIVDSSLKLGSTDNCTAVVVLLGAKQSQRLNEKLVL